MVAFMQHSFKCLCHWTSRYFYVSNASKKIIYEAFQYPTAFRKFYIVDGPICAFIKLLVKNRYKVLFSIACPVEIVKFVLVLQWTGGSTPQAWRVWEEGMPMAMMSLSTFTRSTCTTWTGWSINKLRWLLGSLLHSALVLLSRFMLSSFSKRRLLQRNFYLVKSPSIAIMDKFEMPCVDKIEESILSHG